MQKAVKLKSSKDFSRLFNEGRYQGDECFVIYYDKNNLDKIQVGFSAVKKIGIKVDRNKAKRLVRELFRLNEDKIKSGYDIVIVAKNKVLELKFTCLTDKFICLLKRCKLLIE